MSALIMLFSFWLSYVIVFFYFATALVVVAGAFYLLYLAVRDEVENR